MPINTLAKKEYGNNYVRIESPDGTAGIDLCLSDPVTISTNVDFAPAPIATIGEKIQQFMQNPLLEAANAANGVYAQNVLTDEYSALILGGNKNTLKFDLKFRTYSSSVSMPHISTTQNVTNYLTGRATIKQLNVAGLFSSTGTQIGIAAEQLAGIVDTLRGTPDKGEVSAAIQTSDKALRHVWKKNISLVDIYILAAELFVREVLNTSENGIQFTNVLFRKGLGPISDTNISSNDIKNIKVGDFKSKYSTNIEQRLAAGRERGTGIDVNFHSKNLGLKEFDANSLTPIQVVSKKEFLSALDDNDYKIKYNTKKGEQQIKGNDIDDLGKDNAAKVRDTLYSIYEKAAKNILNATLPVDGVDETVAEAWAQCRQSVLNELNGNVSKAKKGVVEKLDDAVEKGIPLKKADYQSDLHILYVLPYESWLNVLLPKTIYEEDTSGHVVVIDRFDFTADKFGRWCDWTISASTHVVPAYNKPNPKAK